MITVYGSRHCARCNMIKKTLEKKQMAFSYELMENLSEEEQDTIVGEAQAVGVHSLPIVKVDGVVSKQYSNGVI